MTQDLKVALANAEQAIEDLCDALDLDAVADPPTVYRTRSLRVRTLIDQLASEIAETFRHGEG